MTHRADAFVPAMPAEWHGTEEAFVACLSVFATALLEAVAKQIDANQRQGIGDPTTDAYNAAVIDSARYVMSVVSDLRSTQRTDGEWTASSSVRGKLEP